MSPSAMRTTQAGSRKRSCWRSWNDHREAELPTLASQQHLDGEAADHLLLPPHGVQPIGDVPARHSHSVSALVPDIADRIVVDRARDLIVVDCGHGEPD